MTQTAEQSGAGRGPARTDWRGNVLSAEVVAQQAAAVSPSVRDPAAYTSWVEAHPVRRAAHD